MRRNPKWLAICPVCNKRREMEKQEFMNHLALHKSCFCQFRTVWSCSFGGVMQYRIERTMDIGKLTMYVQIG